jgi:hypothetical protein
MGFSDRAKHDVSPGDSMDGFTAFREAHTDPPWLDYDNAALAG